MPTVGSEADRLIDHHFPIEMIVGDVIKCIVQIVTRKCNFYNLTKSSTFNLERVPNLKDPNLARIGLNSPIPRSSTVIKLIFSKPIHIVYRSI